jgi:hypothetical protein
MIDPKMMLDFIDSPNLTPEMKSFLNATRSKLKGCQRRKFMAEVVRLMGKGGQRRAEHELGWDRKTIQKGIKELTSGFDCADYFAGRGGTVSSNPCRICLRISKISSARSASVIRLFGQLICIRRLRQNKFTTG